MGSLHSWRDLRGSAVAARRVRTSQFEINLIFPRGFAARFAWRFRRKKSTPRTRIPPATQATNWGILRDFQNRRKMEGSQGPSCKEARLVHVNLTPTFICSSGFIDCWNKVWNLHFYSFLFFLQKRGDKQRMKPQEDDFFLKKENKNRKRKKKKLPHPRLFLCPFLCLFLSYPFCLFSPFFLSFPSFLFSSSLHRHPAIDFDLLQIRKQ